MILSHIYIYVLWPSKFVAQRLRKIARYAAAKPPPEAVEGLRNLAAEDRGLGLGGLGPLTWDVWYTAT